MLVLPGRAFLDLATASLSPVRLGMDSSSDAGPTGRVSPEPTLTAYRQGATGDVAVTAPQFAFPSSSDTWTSSPPLDSQSRDNLRQASVALDTAYERITSLRNSINDMLNRIPRETAGAGTPTNSTDSGAAQPRNALSHDTSIRPSHSALVLTSEQVVEELNLRAARLRSLIPTSARQRLEEFESGNGDNTRRESVWDRFSQGDRPRLEPLPIPPRSRTPPMPNPVQPRAADPVDPRAAQRRDLQSVNRDESSTMIGRRVAARVNSSDTQGTLSSRLTLSEIEQRLQAQTAQIARELENMTDRLAAQRSRRVELASSSVRGDTPAVAARDRTSRVGNSDSRSVLNPPAGRRPLGPARDVTFVDNTAHIVLPEPISRTSSNGTPIDEFLSPNRRTLSAAFREHIATYRDHVQVAHTYLDTPRNLANTPEVRGTLVNLLARDRDDQSQPARRAELVRSDVDNRRGDASTRSNPSPPAGQGRRRRGWGKQISFHIVSCLTHGTARLNADGDEIDSDEDDNVSPNTRRLRMRFAYGTNVDQPARSHTVTIEDILWRTSGSDSEVDVLSPDSTESCPSLFQGSPPRPAVRRPHPLPTPAEDMLAYPIVKLPQRPRVVCVSKYASLAGR